MVDLLEWKIYSAKVESFIAYVLSISQNQDIIMSVYQIAVEYFLVYCTSVGLTAIGEPSLAKFPAELDGSISLLVEDKPPMPVWITFVFVFMAGAKWFLSFLVNISNPYPLTSLTSLQIQYIYLVISTVMIVATTRIKTVAAANAKTHEYSQRARLDQLTQKIRVLGAFKSAKADRLNREAKSRRLSRVSVSEVKADLKRRSTMEAQKHVPRRRGGPIMKAWQRITGLPCFRGFTPLLTITIAQWLLAFVTDFLLSGQPAGHKLGYGTTSLVLQTVFASAYAVWTHYTITKPSNKRVFDHFPKGGEVLIELWPMTALWAVADHLCLSGPLALSRSFGLKQYAFDAESWNALSASEMRIVLMQFAIVFSLYASLVAFVSVPMTMITRRVHASMLSDEDLAIVPCHRYAGEAKDRALNNFDDRAKIRKPGLSFSQAWATITWPAYFQALRVYAQYFFVNQIVQMVYWTANWKLHVFLQVDRYATTKLPWSPVGVVKALSGRHLPEMGDEGLVGKTEL